MIRSFFIVIYGGDGRSLRSFQVPVAVAAPFANRLFKEVPGLPEWHTLSEPWYILAPRYDTDPPLRRSPHPAGPSSLYGGEFVPGEATGPGVRMHPEAVVRYFEVRLLDQRDELYRGEYSVDDVFLHGAHYLIEHGIERGTLPGDCGPYSYAIVPSTEVVRTVPADLLPDDAYQVEGGFRLPPRAKESPRIRFRRVPQPPPPELDPEELGPARSHGQGEPQAGRVLLPDRVFADLRRDLRLSDKEEEGGYLLGNVYRIPGSPEDEDDGEFRWAVEVTDLVMAEDTVGSAALLLFTGDSWSKISRRLDKEFSDRKLVGWFHTHLFAATDDFGLSGLDQDMHAWYLPKPWQVAVLLNLESDGERTVRCFQRGPEADLVETPFEVLSE